MRVLTHVLFSGCIAVAFTGWCEADTVVVPSEFANAEAPNAADLTDFPSYRLQQVYSASEFESAASGPVTITRVDWRPGSEMIETIDYPSDRFIINFSTTDVDPATPDSVFDPVFANNIGSNERTVFDGPVTLTTENAGPAEGPKAFDYGLDLQTPYVYDPSAGNLMMDLTVFNGQTPLLLDYIFDPNETTAAHWTGTLGVDSEQSEQQLGGHVIQFEIASVKQRPYFWDEFDREEVFDSPIPYVDDDPDVEFEIQDGSLTVTSLSDTFPGLFAIVEDTPNFVLKTQARLLDADTCAIQPFLGVLGRDEVDGISSNYWGGYSSNGRLSLGDSVNGAISTRTQQFKFSCDEAIQQDVHMELRAVGEEIEFTSWLDGTEKPTEPDLVMQDDALEVSEYFGVLINPSAQLEGFVLRYLALLPAFAGDFNGSDTLDAGDIDLLSEQVALGENNRVYDLNEDAMVDEKDRIHLVHDLLNTYFGDSDLDGEFNSTDLVEVFRAGKYELDVNAGWAEGDWTGDRRFDSGDLVAAFADGGYEAGVRASVDAVPEPTCAVLLVFGAVGLVNLRSRRIS